MGAYEVERAALCERFGGILRELRKERCPSQEALAEAASLHRTYVSLLERGQREPSLSTLLILSDALDVSVEQLLAGLPVPEERRPAPAPHGRRHRS